MASSFACRVYTPGYQPTPWGRWLRSLLTGLVVAGASCQLAWAQWPGIPNYRTGKPGDPAAMVNTRTPAGGGSTRGGAIYRGPGAPTLEEIQSIKFPVDPTTRLPAFLSTVPCRLPQTDAYQRVKGWAAGKEKFGFRVTSSADMAPTILLFKAKVPLRDYISHETGRLADIPGTFNALFDCTINFNGREVSYEFNNFAFETRYGLLYYQEFMDKATNPTSKEIDMWAKSKLWAVKEHVQQLEKELKEVLR